ncbi:hypothetical protein N2603_20255 [Bradyrhizobium huanghuaihaiense]|uniref:hypothetical protein n=1 Tax=Bradyrhizobium huanghuaihaiense TaxID=990078 RepID=UPI0021AA2E91|nr:hypothetical protein [Bradyrhizobium sp. CB3035]UWU80708.1 hypothetical protein N2603_20255 [Bradyrhizobium sp. CB3035]
MTPLLALRSRYQLLNAQSQPSSSKQFEKIFEREGLSTAVVSPVFPKLNFEGEGLPAKSLI